ncbi:MAG: putative toxin-antitoxin system toxin component, PIN family [candidate division NC10 bacterium RBG_16_65_8]|nr:MAG: putative toxin-antitoxin system toxin component, PIN family [candidate division NC10 bacterium RBG_16_65_8]
MHRVVLDTNVIASGLIAPTGPPGTIFLAWKDRRLDLIVSPTLLREVADILSRSKIARTYGITADAVTGVLHLLHSQAIRVPGRLGIPRTTRDPRDDHILACAVEGHADYIVCGDDDLLSLGRYARIPIVRPATYVRLLEGS